jgi:hypothetical protein
LREACDFLGLEFDPSMLAYHRDPDAGSLRDHPRLAEPPGLSSRWRQDLGPGQVELFEAIAGELLSDLGYDRAHPRPSAGARARAGARRAASAASLAVWNGALVAVRKTPVWRLRQVYVRRTFEEGVSP